MTNYDFGGWATKYNLKCSDGRTILKGAFAHCNNMTVPLVWNHQYTGPEAIIGKASLVHKDDGVYAYCEFNESDTAEQAKLLVKHGDITSLSIYANKLKQSNGMVMHGDIKEVSLVLAGANPGASIQEVLLHGEIDCEAATIYTGEELELFHADGKEAEEGSLGDETLADVYKTFSEKQKLAVAMIIDQLTHSDMEEKEEEAEESKEEKEEKTEESKEEENKNEDNSDNEGDSTMKHNVFDQKEDKNTLKHTSIDILAAVRDAKRCGSFKASFLQHAATYGIEDIESLFPEVKDIYNHPEFIKRDTSWVGPFMSAVKKSPFSKLRAVYADITADAARARGYMKGNLKKEEVFTLLRRTTEPTTIYKKQKLDRDDIIDITSFDVVAWIKAEMRMMLDEEIARAILVGDGRDPISQADDKVNEKCIRPIFNDEDLYTIKYAVDNAAANPAKEFIKACIKSRIDYEGIAPNLYTSEELVTEMLLIEDENGRFIYSDEAALARVLRVNKIVTVPFLKNLTRDAKDAKTHNVLGIIVNPSDYTVGADKGGKVGMFDDFDIDYNQYKYLIETRMSGSLLKPKTAITIESVK